MQLLLDIQLTQVQRYQLESDSIRRTRGKQHIQQPGWEARVGSQLRKKDRLVIEQTRRNFEQKDRNSLRINRLSIELQEMYAHQEAHEQDQERMAEFLNEHVACFKEF